MKQRSPLPKVVLVTFAILCFGCFATAAQASPISYLFSATGVSGLYGPTAIEFSDGQFVVALSGDTTNYDTSLGAENPAVFNMTANISFTSAVGSFTSAMVGLYYTYIDRSFVNDPTDPVALVGFGVYDTLDPFGPFLDSVLEMAADPALLGAYDLLSAPFGPIAGINAFVALLAGGLEVEFIDVPGGTSMTFQAVPLPGAVVLLGSGLVALLGFKRRFIG